MKKVYIVIKLLKNENNRPVYAGVYSKKEDAEKVAYSGGVWGNIIEDTIDNEQWKKVWEVA